MTGNSHPGGSKHWQLVHATEAGFKCWSKCELTFIKEDRWKSKENILVSSNNTVSCKRQYCTYFRCNNSVLSVF